MNDLPQLSAENTDRFPAQLMAVALIHATDEMEQLLGLSAPISRLKYAVMALNTLKHMTPEQLEALLKEKYPEER